MRTEKEKEVEKMEKMAQDIAEKLKPNMASLVNEEPEPENMKTDEKDSEPASPDQ